MPKCLFCGQEEVDLADWNKRGPKCRAEQKEKDEEEKIRIIKPLPAARIVTEDGREVWVDKFGREVENPGYDVKNDPRGWNKTGLVQGKREVIS